MSSSPQTVYVPAWVDDLGNRLLFLGSSEIQESSGLAYARQLQTYPLYRELGLRMDGVAEIEKTADGYKFVHAQAKLAGYVVYCIAGPNFEKARQEDEQEQAERAKF